MSAGRCCAMPARRQRGAATVEFFATVLALIMLIMAIMQMGMFFVAKNTVNLATFAAARAGAASGGDPVQMRVTFAKATSSLYVAKGLRAAGSDGLADVSSTNFTTVVNNATLYSGLLSAPVYTQLDTLNPRRAAFTDFGVANPAGGSDRIIQATGLLSDTAVGASSRQTRADALLLKIEVRHCYEMVFPLIDAAVSETILQFPVGMSVWELACYAKHPMPPDGRMAYGVPVVSQAVVRMTVPAIQRHFN